MKFKYAKHVVPFLAILMVFSLTACPNTQAWINTALQIIPVIEPIIVAGVQGFAQLSGKTIPADDLALIQSSTIEVQGDLQTVQALTQQYQSTKDPTLVAKINTLLDAIRGRLAQILAGIHVKDQATIARIKAFVDLVVNEVRAIENMIPLFQNGKLMARPRVKGAALAPPLTAQQLKESYNRLVTTPSGNADVDQAFVGKTVR